MLEVVDELRARIALGEITSLALIAEAISPGPPRSILLGRYNVDSHRALVALSVAKTRVIVRADALRSDFFDR
jgi:hypothetical protein